MGKTKTKTEIIDELAKEKTIEKFISNTAKTSNEDLRDLSQDIYLSLLQQDEEKLQDMYERNELEFFIARVITNNIRSFTSPYYSHYKKWSDKRSELRGEPRISEIIENEGWIRKANAANSSEN